MFYPHLYNFPPHLDMAYSHFAQVTRFKLSITVKILAFCHTRDQSGRGYYIHNSLKKYIGILPQKGSIRDRFSATCNLQTLLSQFSLHSVSKASKSPSFNAGSIFGSLSDLSV